VPKPSKKPPLSLSNCPIARASEILGDRWTLLILRELFHGTTRFGEFVEILGIARNLLTDRLKRMEYAGLVMRFTLPDSPGRDGYRLTEKGEDTFPLIAGLMQWGNQWLARGDGAPVEMQSRRKSEPVGVAVLPESKTRAALTSNDIRLVAGPGAKRGTRARLDFIEERRNVGK